MTSRAIGPVGFLILIMARKTGRVRIGGILKECGGRCKTVGCRVSQRLKRRQAARPEFWQSRRCFMAHRAIVKYGRFQIIGSDITCARKMSDRHVVLRTVRCDQVLVYVMRKNCRELLRARAHRKRKTSRTPRPGVCVTSGTYRRPVSGKKIRTVAADARCVAGIIGNVRIAACGDPVRGRIFMTRCAVDLDVRCRCVGKTLFSPLSRGNIQKSVANQHRRQKHKYYSNAVFHFCSHFAVVHTIRSFTTTSQALVDAAGRLSFAVLPGSILTSHDQT